MSIHWQDQQCDDSYAIKVIYGSNVITIEIPTRFLLELEKESQIARAIPSRVSNAGGIPTIKLHHRVIVTKTAWCWHTETLYHQWLQFQGIQHLSFGLRGYQAHKQCTDIHVGKTPTGIKYLLKIKHQNQTIQSTSGLIKKFSKEDLCSQ